MPKIEEIRSTVLEQQIDCLLGLKLDPEHHARYLEIRKTHTGESRGDALDTFELRVAVRNAISNLPKKQQELVFDVLEQKQANEKINLSDTAKRMGEQRTTIQWRWASALLRMHKSLQLQSVVQEWLDP